MGHLPPPQYQTPEPSSPYRPATSTTTQHITWEEPQEAALCGPILTSGIRVGIFSQVPVANVPLS